MCSITIKWSEDTAAEDDESHSIQGQRELLQFIKERVPGLAHLEVANDLAYDSEGDMPESLSEKLNMTNLVSLKLHPGPSMASPTMRRILLLPLLQNLEIRYMEHESDWLLELKSAASGMQELAFCRLQHSYTELPHILHQLLSDLDVIRSVVSLKLSVQQTGNHIPLEIRRDCWRGCGASVPHVQLSSTVEELYIVDDVLTIGDDGASFMDILEGFRHCANIEVVEHSSRYGSTDHRSTYILASATRRIADIWPRLTHFASDARFLYNLSFGGDYSWMNIGDLRRIVRDLPQTLESIRIKLRMPEDWDAIPIDITGYQQWNIKNVELRCRADSPPKDSLAVRPDLYTVQRVVGLLLDYFPSLMGVQVEDYALSDTELALRIIKGLKADNRHLGNCVSGFAGRKVSVGDVFRVENVTSRGQRCRPVL
jgi:hypothetical protein